MRCVLAAFCSLKNTARSRSLKAQWSCCSFWPKLSNDPNLSKIRPCLAEIGPTLFQSNQQERTAPNQRNRLSTMFLLRILVKAIRKKDWDWGTWTELQFQLLKELQNGKKVYSKKNYYNPALFMHGPQSARAQITFASDTVSLQGGAWHLLR